MTAASARRSSRRSARSSRKSSSGSCGNFGAGEKPPSCGVVPSQALLDRRREQLVAELGGFARRRRHAGDRGGDPLRLCRQLGPPLAPRRRRLTQQVDERRARQVGAAEEGLAVTREQARHRPAAAAGGELDRGHVDRVDIRPLLAIDLDADEALVHQAGDGLVVEALPFHHVAPVAGGVADRQEDRLVLPTRPVEGLGSPGVPVDGVVRVLNQIGGGLEDQAVDVDRRAVGAQMLSARSVAWTHRLVGLPETARELWRCRDHAGQERRAARFSGHVGALGGGPGGCARGRPGEAQDHDPGARRTPDGGGGAGEQST